MKILFQLFIALIPLVFSFTTNDPTLSIRFIYLSVGVSIFLFANFYRKEKFYYNLFINQFFICFFLVFIFCFISSLIHGLTPDSIYFLSKIFLLIIFVLLASNFLLKNSFKDFLIPLLLFSFFSSLIYFYQLYDQYDSIVVIEDSWHRNKAFDSISGSMGHKNLLASIHFLILPFIIYSIISTNKFLKYFSYICLFFSLIIFFQTQSRAVIGALLISSISYLLFSKISKKRLIISLKYIASIVIVGFLFLYSINRIDSFKQEITKNIDFTTSQRFSLYKSSIKLISDNLIFGVGPANWRIKIWEYGLYNNTFGDSFAQRPHNDFLWFFSEGGLVVGISFLLLFLILLRDSFWLSKNHEDSIFYKLLFATILGYSFISFFDFPSERISHLIIFLLIASIIISRRIVFDENKFFTIPHLLKFSLAIICLSIFYFSYNRFQSDKFASKAIAFKNKGNWTQTIKNIDRAYHNLYYAVDGTSTPLHYYRGIANYYQNKIDLALIDFKKAYNHNCNHIHVLNNLGTIHEIKGKYKLAKEYYNKALKVNPTFKDVRENLSAIFYNEGEYVRALDMILASKVDVYWKRQRSNDNYDFFLKTIFSAWVNSIKDDLNKKDVNLLNKIKDNFEKHPATTAEKLKEIFYKRKSLDNGYLKTIREHYVL